MLLDLSPAAAQSVAEICKALASDDIEQSRRAAHVLNGCASTFGAVRLAALACEIELELPSIDAMRLLMPILLETLDLTAASLVEVAKDGTAVGTEQ
jgi:HPt (histidine-containing phosphotransfer) domain-containing protein